MRLILFLIFSPIFIGAQPFFKTYGGDSGKDAFDIALTSDGGFIVAGSSSSFGGGGSDIYVLKTDHVGDTLWTRTYGTVFIDVGFSVQETFDGGYIVAGQLGVPDTMSETLSDIYVLKLDIFGDTLWSYHWDAGQGDRVFSVQQTKDSTYILAGVVNFAINNAGDHSAFLLELNEQGEELWKQTFESSSIARSVIKTADGGYLFCGEYGYPPFAETYLVKTTTSGDVIWTKKGSLGFPYGWASDIIQTSDNGYAISGTISSGGGIQNGFLSKIDAAGNLVWTKMYGGEDDDRLRSIDTLRNNGGFILSGVNHSYSTGEFTNTNIWLIKTNEEGDVIWNRSYGSESSEENFSIRACEDGGFVTVGKISSLQSDLYILKTDSLGNGPMLLDVKENIAKSHPRISIYPNPVQDVLFLNWETLDPFHQSFLLQLFDCFGRLVKEEMIQPIFDQQKSIDIKDLAPGSYFYRLSNNDRAYFYTGKVIKK